MHIGANALALTIRTTSIPLLKTFKPSSISKHRDKKKPKYLWHDSHIYDKNMYQEFRYSPEKAFYIFHQ